MPFAHVRSHYERHPYPYYSLLTSVRRHDTYAMNLQSLWARFNGEYLAPNEGKILIAGSGAFSPYPTSLANPLACISAVDLAESNIRRARLHCLLHGCRNVSFFQGDFLHTEVAPGPFHLIDAFGVLHHLDNPVEGLKSLEQRLLPGGILRVMVYGRYARKEAESIRRAAHLLGIRDIHAMKRLLNSAPPEAEFGSMSTHPGRLALPRELLIYFFTRLFIPTEWTSFCVSYPRPVSSHSCSLIPTHVPTLMPKLSDSGDWTLAANPEATLSVISAKNQK